MYEQEKQLVAEARLAYVKDGMIVGLGTGSTTERFIEALGPLVHAGLQIQGVATSLATVELAERLQIPLIDLEEGMEIDVTIDGIDQIDGQFQTIKGGGGALFREKIVALMSRELLYLTDSSKFVHHLSGPLPV
ncbi:ribose 5-phosphate isomerase A [Exiguobacterium sp. SL14]|nr:ribose 5-phosphate isomerase A [Exiguobacterium sp. SL14]MCY1691638.1 ribose 5-phosphate isomerase A [Exiguobacterium sp. SL14]